MIKLSLQSDIDERTEMALDMLHEMHSMGVLLHIYVKQEGTVHVDQLMAAAAELDYGFVEGDTFFAFTKIYRLAEPWASHPEPWAPHLKINEKLTVW